MTNALVVRISSAQKKQLTLEAQKQNSSISDVVRNALSEHFFNDQNEEKNLFAQLSKIGEAGRKKSSPKKLSTDYKKYLYG